jgi:catechol 2,3-dioxygenase-like lactoylglutathione lyase family enzyme
MKRTWTIIGVSDVPGSLKWYQRLFGQAETPPAHEDFGQIVDPDGTVLLCLHQWGAHAHPSLMSRDQAPPGNGLLLFFRDDDFDITLQRARALVARLEEEPHVNANTRTWEFSIRDPEGYHVTISAKDRGATTSSPPQQRVVPTLRITSYERSKAFFVDGLGFQIDWEHRFKPHFPVFMQVSREELSFFLSAHSGDCAVGGLIHLYVSNVDAWFAEFQGRNISVKEPPNESLPGLRSMTVVDPDGNKIMIHTRLPGWRR